MARFKDFHIWRGKLPHWRASGEVYYVTFRHSRPLTNDERGLLMAQILKQEGKRWALLVLCVLDDRSELMFRVQVAPTGMEYEFSAVLEKAKRKTGALIIKRTGEQFPPFYFESYDRIVRDEAELEERWREIVSAPVRAGLSHETEEYPYLWVAQTD